VHNCTAVFRQLRQNNRMKIGIIGSGKMGGGLGRLWAEQGHHVMFSYSRRPEKLQDLVKEIGSHATSGTPRDASGFGDIVFLAVPWATIGDALVAAGSLEGKILITCVNPFGLKGLEVGFRSSAAEEISKLAPGAIVIEAFNTIFANILRSRAHVFGDNTPTVFFCGDHRDAKSKVAKLIGDAGLQPVDAGPLQNARYLEPLAMLMMELGYSRQMGSDIAMRLMNPAGASELVTDAEVLATSLA
jgi:predicted dinucleotide-binding enzyme